MAADIEKQTGPMPPPLRCVLWHSPGATLPGDLLTGLSKRIGRITVCTDAYAAMAEACAKGEGGTALVLVEPAGIVDAAEVVTELGVYAPGVQCWKFDARTNPKLSAVVEKDVTEWAARGASAAAGVLSSIARPNARAGADEQRHSSTISSPFTPASMPRRAPASHIPSAASAEADEARPALRLADDQEQPKSRGSAELRPPEVVVRPRPEGRAPAPPPKLTLRGEAAAGVERPAPARSLLTTEEMRMLLGDDPIDEPARVNGHASEGEDRKP